MNDTKVFFVDYQKKQVFPNKEKHDFIIEYSNISKFDIYLIVIDSDSKK